jgi:hypothetical protein
MMSLEPKDIAADDPAVLEVEKVFDTHKMMSLNFIARSVVAWHLNRLSQICLDLKTFECDSSPLQKFIAQADRGDNPKGHVA